MSHDPRWDDLERERLYYEQVEINGYLDDFVSDADERAYLEEENRR